MVEKFYLKSLRLVNIRGKLYYHLSLETFDHLGIFAFTVKHQRLGYLFCQTSKNVIFKYYENSEDRQSLISIEGLPYLMIYLAILVSAGLVALTGMAEDLKKSVVKQTNKRVPEREKVKIQKKTRTRKRAKDKQRDIQ